MKILILTLLLWGSDKKVVIQKADKVDGRQTYHVKVGEKTYEYMYLEEISHSVKTGVWEYNEYLTINKKTK